MRFTIEIDPSHVSTSQQRFISFRRRMVVPNPKVVRATREIIWRLKTRAKAIRAEADEAIADGRSGIVVAFAFWFPFPKTGTKKEKAERYEGQPVRRRPDCDNLVKAVGDAVVKSGALPDDQFDTTLIVRKRYTFGQPRLVVGVAKDDGKSSIFDQDILDTLGVDAPNA